MQTKDDRSRVLEIDRAFEGAEPRVKHSLLDELIEIDSPTGAWTAARAISSESPQLAEHAIRAWSVLARARSFDRHGYPVGYLPALESFRKLRPQHVLILRDLLGDDYTTPSHLALIRALAYVNLREAKAILQEVVRSGTSIESLVAAKALTRWLDPETWQTLIDAMALGPRLGADRRTPASRAVAELGSRVLPNLVTLASRLSPEHDYDKLSYLALAVQDIKDPSTAAKLVDLFNRSNQEGKVGAMRLMVLRNPSFVAGLQRSDDVRIRQEARRLTSKFGL